MSSQPVASPCIEVCTMDARTGWCEGCLRSLDEIAAWGGLDDTGKRRILALLPGRRQRQRGAESPQDPPGPRP